MTGLPAERPVAVVTGAASGIGAACAVHLARAGYDVAVNYNSNSDGAAATVAACEAEGAAAQAIAGDVASDGDCRVLVARTVDLWGRLDALVNNAGVTKFVDADDLGGLEAEDFQDIFSVNLGGAWFMSRAARAELERSDRASIVNVSSHSGISGIGSSIAYAASKGALNTLTLGLARTLAPKIRVNAVCPGYVTTDWARQQHPDDASVEAFRASVAEISPLKRDTTADDVGDAVHWLTTSARAVTGILLVIDGGTHLTVGSPMKSDV